MTDAARRRLAAAADRVSTPGAALAALAVLAELALVVAYVGLTGADVTGVRYLAYPFVWINVGAWAVLAVPLPDAPRRARWAATAAAVAYLLALAYFGGLLDVAHLGHGHSHGGRSGLAVFTALPPGWGPTVVYDHAWFTATLVPFKAVGYLALAYLVYAALLDAVTAAATGAVGLLSCVSCSWPVFASLLAGVVGGGAVVTAVYTYAVDLSTTAFVLAVALLVWRPGAGDLA